MKITLTWNYSSLIPWLLSLIYDELFKNFSLDIWFHSRNFDRFPSNICTRVWDRKLLYCKQCQFIIGNHEYNFTFKIKFFLDHELLFSEFYLHVHYEWIQWHLETLLFQIFFCVFFFHVHRSIFIEEGSSLIEREGSNLFNLNYYFFSARWNPKNFNFLITYSLHLLDCNLWTTESF